MLRSLARRLGWMAIKRFIVLLSRAGQAGVAVQCTALPPLHVLTYLFRSINTHTKHYREIENKFMGLFIFVNSMHQAYSFSTLFLQMINYHVYTNYFQMNPDHTLNEGPHLLISEIGFE